MPLRRMKGQRREHEQGDLFVLQLDQDGSFRPGRIVKLGQHTPQARFPGDMLIYLYRDPLAEPVVAEPEALTPDRLLMPPEFTTGWMWTKGYFRTVGHQSLRPGDLLAQHCFYDADSEGYVDENDRRLDRRYEPCGTFGMPVFEWLAEEIDAGVAGKPMPAPYPTEERA